MKQAQRALAGLAVAALTSAAVAGGDGITTYPVDGSFDDATFGIESAITNRGLVIDHVSHVGDMLNRTAGDVGAATTVYAAANVYLFCSATLSREMMEDDISNIGHCPYGIFAYEAGDGSGDVLVGYRHYPDGAMQKVQALLDEIAREAAGID